MTEHGEAAVETLRTGDPVRTLLDGPTQAVIWVGGARWTARGIAKPRKVWPVRVAAGAFGPGRPHRDLFLSPDHAVYVKTC